MACQCADSPSPEGSLRQVERIRGQVASIDSRKLDGRVEVPPTSDELQALALTMNTMLERLQAADRDQRRFVSDASHELRSPLATLSAGVEIAAADPTGATWQEMNSVLAGETARMRHLVEDLLTLAKTNDGGLRLETLDVDLDDVLGQELRRLRSTSSHRIEATFDPARTTGDARRLGQVVRNVLDNADRHARSRIGITLTSTAQGAVVTIDNDGPPVPVPERERIFERFVRLDESRSREGGGSGLGLAIAAAIMAAHHAGIRATETPDGGCRFELTFPRSPAARRGIPVPAAAGRAVPGRAAPRRTGRGRLRGCRVRPGFPGGRPAGGEHVSHSPHGGEGLQPERGVDFPAQVTDVDLHDVVSALKRGSQTLSRISDFDTTWS
ncbi:sensor protein CzcS [Arthrobacter sp. Hiyo8]|nr:sensor protein CzcS [Arthrobacter sp. Hiyo8]